MWYTMKTKVIVIFGFLLLFSVQSFGQEAQEGDKKDSLLLLDLLNRKRMYVVQEKLFKKAPKLEIAPLVGGFFNDPFWDTLTYGGEAFFHFSEFFAIGGSYRHAKTWQSNNAKPLEEVFNIRADSSILNYMALGNIIITPIYAKASLFGRRVMHFDFYFTAGAGLINTTAEWSEEIVETTGTTVVQQSQDGSSPAYNFGLGARVFLTKHISFKIELSNVLYQDSVRNEEQWFWRIPVNVGFGVFLP